MANTNSTEDPAVVHLPGQEEGGEGKAIREFTIHDFNRLRNRYFRLRKSHETIVSERDVLLDQNKKLSEEIRRLRQHCSVGEEITELSDVPEDHCIKIDMDGNFVSFVRREGELVRRDDKSFTIPLESQSLKELSLPMFKEVTSGGQWRRVRTPVERKKENDRMKARRANRGPQ
jgi:hypothetical protein